VTFDVEVYWPVAGQAGTPPLVSRVRATVADMAGAGRGIRFLGATLSPADEVCFLRFEASREDLEEVLRSAGLTGARISEVVVVAGPVPVE
jgi:hypothetical protein